MATYLNASRHVPAYKIWVGNVCLWPGQRVTVPFEIPESHPDVALGWLRRIDGHTEEVKASSVEPVNAPTKPELWRELKGLEGGTKAFTEKTGLKYNNCKAADLLRYLEETQWQS